MMALLKLSSWSSTSTRAGEVQVEVGTGAHIEYLIPFLVVVLYSRTYWYKVSETSRMSLTGPHDRMPAVV